MTPETLARFKDIVIADNLYELKLTLADGSRLTGAPSESGGDYVVILDRANKGGRVVVRFNDVRAAEAHMRDGRLLRFA